MNRLALSLGFCGALALASPVGAARASVETPEAKVEASVAAAIARDHMLDQFGGKELKAGQFMWKDSGQGGPARVVIGLTDQLAYVYRGEQLVAVSTISSGKPGNDTPTGIFTILDKRKFYRSIKYENAPMPHMQRIDKYGIALHGGMLPGYPASHGCIRLPANFAAKLFSLTQLGTPVLIGI